MKVYSFLKAVKYQWGSSYYIKPIGQKIININGRPILISSIGRDTGVQYGTISIIGMERDRIITLINDSGMKPDEDIVLAYYLHPDPPDKIDFLICMKDGLNRCCIRIESLNAILMKS